jgi:hypothetical protein
MRIARQGPGAKIYVLTLYALNAQPTIAVSNTQVTMDILIAGMKNKIVSILFVAPRPARKDAINKWRVSFPGFEFTATMANNKTSRWVSGFSKPELE